MRSTGKGIGEKKNEEQTNEVPERFHKNMNCRSNFNAEMGGAGRP